MPRSSDTRLYLAVGAHGCPTGFELQVDDRRVRFGFDEGRQLVEQWPGKLGAIAAMQASRGDDRLEVELGGESVRLTATQARQLAGLPCQLLSLFALAETMSTARERVG